ncbi:hypothetical protein MXD62_14775 [Frankia sp. Mgl5]|nr:hypothetical protein [Frankia sp. Mgl5]
MALTTGFAACWWSTASTPAGWRRATGTVMSVEYGARGAVHVTVRFSDGHAQFLFRQDSPMWSREAPTDPKIGEQIPIIYDTGRPADARVAGWGNAAAEFFGLPSPIVACYGVVRIVFALYDRARRHSPPDQQAPRVTPRPKGTQTSAGSNSRSDASIE